jgi:hypothetical protein
MRFFITELPILPSSGVAPMTCHGVGLHDASHGPQDLLLRRPVARLWRGKIHDDTHVHSRGSGATGKHRVQIHFVDGWEVMHELRHLFDQRAQSLAVDPRCSTHSV